MSVEVSRADEDDLADWDDHVARSPVAGPFHRWAALDVQATHADCRLHPLVGRVGQEVVGVFPAFERRVGPVRAAFAPPPGLRVPYLGPATLNLAKLGQRKTERRRRRFVEGCLDWIDREVGPRYLHLRTDGTTRDLRPFLWNDCEVTPRHTYVVTLDDPDAVRDRFSADARRNLRGADPDDYEVRVGGHDAIETVLDRVRERYRSRGLSFGVPTAFVQDLYDRLGPETVRPYVLSVDDEVRGGILALEHGDTVYRWQGGARVDGDVDLAVNELLDWHVMRDAIDRGLDRYDLVGADAEGVAEYKAKFGPDLHTFHGVTSGSTVTTALARLYRRVGGR